METLTEVYLLLSMQLPLILLYAGPDQLLPLASFLGALIGILLIGWQRLVMLARRSFQFLAGKFQPSAKKVRSNRAQPRR
jgi:hypothetical protein